MEEIFKTSMEYEYFVSIFEVLHQELESTDLDLVAVVAQIL